ncbi:MAG TPA: LamG-like jellyroll fold domain-containing protein, partial [Labilithrix sp.]
MARLVAPSLVLASACGIDAVGTGQTVTSTSPTDVNGPPHGSGTGMAPPGDDSDASVGACRDAVLSFDGADDFANIPHDDALDLGGDFTVEAWIKPGAKTTEMHVVSHHDTNESSGWLLRIASGRVEIVIYGSETFSDQGYSAGNSGASYVVPGKWAHVAGTLSGGTL